MAPAQSLCFLTVIPLCRAWLCFCLPYSKSVTHGSLCPPGPHTCSLSPAHICPHSLWVPVTSFLFFFPLSILKARESSSHCCPPSCRGCSAPDLPAWFHPSLMASSWLHWPPPERGSQPTSQGESSSPPAWLPPWSSAQLSASPGHPPLWALSCVLPRPQGAGKGRREGCSWGKGKREEGEGPPSLIS